MQIVPLTKECYADWDRFCLESDDAWFWHTTEWLEFTLHFRPELKSESKSFFVTDGSRILAICPLILEITEYQGQEVKEFSYGGSFGFTPALANELSEAKRDELFKLVFRHVDELARDNQVQRISIECSPLSPRFLNSHLPEHNYLVKHGFIDVSLSTQVIDLSKSLQALRRGMRKGHRYDIDRGIRSLEFMVFDKDNITKVIFEEYRDLHHKAADRVTRPLVTFQMMHDWITQGNAILAAASLQGRFVGFAHVNTYKDGAYYGSAANDPDLPAQTPAGHALQWTVITWLKEHGFRYYETGLQQYGWLPHDFPSEKQINIARFKRGFGGYTVPLFRGEKYWSRQYYLRVGTERLQRYTSSLPLVCEDQNGA